VSGAIYSDAWYRIADARVSLRPGIRTFKQYYRGLPWIVIEDAFSHRFFRLTPEAFGFLQTLNEETRLDLAWQSYLESYPERAPGQEEVVQLLSQLHVAGLLHFANQSNNQAIDQRLAETKQKELRAKLLSFLYFRLPLWDPDHFLGYANGYLRRIPAWIFVTIWSTVCFLGIAAVLGHWEQVATKSQGVFVWANLPLLYVCMAVMKMVHEAWHGLLCKRFGGEVHSCGLMFLVLTPLPYIDTTASWAFSNRWQRVLVSSAGMLADLFMAALGALAWASTGPGLVNSLAFNVMIIGSVSSIAFNGNPLLRFDAYYALADALDMPNLYQRSNQYWFYLADRFLLGSHSAKEPIDVPSEKKWLLLYAPISLCYRLLVSWAVVLFALDFWFPLGVASLLITSYMIFVAPLWKAANHVFGAGLQATRWRAIGGVGAVVGSVVILVFFVPMPYSIHADGIVQLGRATALYAPHEGKMLRATIGHGQLIHEGNPIVELETKSLTFEVEQLEHERNELLALQRLALAKQRADVFHLGEQLAAKEQKLAERKRRLEASVLRAPHEGRLVAIEAGERLGTWVSQGAPLGFVLDPAEGYQFIAVISQEQAKQLFASAIKPSGVRVLGQADQIIAVEKVVVLPYQREDLPSAALGWLGGGEVPVTSQKGQGEKAVEEFFEVRAKLSVDSTELVELAHGLRGVVRLELADRTIYQRIDEYLRQLVQKRYKLA